MGKLILTLLLVLFSISIVSAKEPCKGKSKSGAACKSTIVNKTTGYCNAHDPKRAKCSGKTKKGTPCNMIVTKGSTTCRLHGATAAKK